MLLRIALRVESPLVQRVSWSWPPLAAAIVGFAWFLRIGAWHTLDVTNLDWLLRGDWAQHLLGWLMFRNEPWRFPIGTLSDALYPVGATTGYMDANPIVSTLLKPFSAILPSDFQFIGPWLALCFTLQGYMGAKLTALMTDRPVHQWLGGCLFAMSPVLVWRVGHDTLCAHWIILALLLIGLRPNADARSARRGLTLCVGLVLLASGIHPYLAAMAWVLTMAFAVRLAIERRHVALAGLGWWAAGCTLAMLATFVLFGYVGRAGLGGPGAGEIASDLLALVNPMGMSHLLPRLAGPFEAEGFAFLGLGGLIACVIGVIVIIQRRILPGTQGLPVVVASVLLALFACAPVIRAGGHPLITMQRAFALLAPVVAPFRSTGRFIWPLHYVVLAGGVWGCVRVFPARRHAATALLACILVVQALDTDTSVAVFDPTGLVQSSMTEWAPAVGHYRHIALVPMRVLGVCGPTPVPHEGVYRYMLLAYRARMTFNSGVFARIPVDAVRDACHALELAVESGPLDPQTIYVVAPEYLDRMRDAKAVCGRIDGDWICVDAHAGAAFRTYLATGRAQ